MLELRVADTASGPAASHILAHFAEEGACLGEDGNTVRAAINDRSLLSEIIVRLDQAGVSIDELSLRRPSLDEVFLSLTGRAALTRTRPEEMAPRVRS